MILIDFNGIAMPVIFLNREFNEDLIRHSIINAIRSYRKKFFNEFGELVLCSDFSRSWRKDYFQYYKANRKKDSNVDWEKYYNILNKVRNEIETNFPYKVIKTQGAEADDIMAILSMNINEPNVIISNDKDMVQLNKFENVKIYSPSKESFISPTREYIKTENKIKTKIIETLTPDEFLLEHIIRGDTSDGIPNILSDDDVFTIATKYQNSIEKKFIQNFNYESLTEDQKQKFNRNKKLISLFEIPEELSNNILKEYNEYEINSRKNIQNYLILNNLNELFDKIQEF